MRILHNWLHDRVISWDKNSMVKHTFKSPYLSYKPLSKLRNYSNSGFNGDFNIALF